MDEIWALYADDGAQALDVAEDALGKIAEGDDAARKDGIASLFRAVHTFKGNSRVLGLQVVESRAHLTEDLIGMVRDQGATWDDEIEAIMQLALDRFRVVLEATASSRQDADESFAVDLMEKLKDKLGRLTEGGTGPDAEVPAPNANDPVESAVEAPAPISGSEDVFGSDWQEPISNGEESGEHAFAASFDQILPPELDSQNAVEKPNDDHSTEADVLSRILQRLTGMQAALSREDRNAILQEIAQIAESDGYRRLADLAVDLQQAKGDKDIRQDVRLYEELYAIELSRSDGRIPSPRPRDLLSGWCAEHAFSLIDDLRLAVSNLAQGIDIEAALRLIEPTLRRINAACDYYNLGNAAMLSMSLLDLVLRVSPEIGRSKDGPDETVVRMLQTFISTVELALDSAREGEPPNDKALNDLADASGKFEFIRRGAKTAPEALETLKLPTQFLRVMSPRSVLVAETAAAEGMRFVVVAAAFQDGTDQAERFFEMMEDGAVRQITSVSVLSAAEVSFEFLLATSLSDEDFNARLAEVDPTGSQIRVSDATDRENATDAGKRHLVSDGVSVEMMEMLGEVSSGLASVIKDLRSMSENESRTRIRSAFEDAEQPEGRLLRLMENELDEVLSKVENSLLTMDHLSRRVTALQEEAMHSRLKPADYALRPLVEQIRSHIRETRQDAAFSFRLDPVPMDRQALEMMEQACEKYFLERLDDGRKHAMSLSFSLRQRDDRVLFLVDDNLAKPPKQEVLESIGALCTLAGGKTFLKAREDQGQRFVISLPTRMLAMEGMVVQSSGVYYVLPVDALLTVVRAPAQQVVRRAAAGSKRFLNLGDGEVLQIITLEGGNPDSGGLFLIVQAEGQRRAVLVDELLGQEVIRLRPLQGVMSKLERLAGMAVLAGGEVALVLSPLAICIDGDMDEFSFAAA